jgi:hypothetical protein
LDFRAKAFGFPVRRSLYNGDPVIVQRRKNATTPLNEEGAAVGDSDRQVADANLGILALHYERSPSSILRFCWVRDIISSKKAWRNFKILSRVTPSRIHWSTAEIESLFD